MAKLVVTAEREELEIIAETDDVEEAVEVFQLLCDDPAYYDVNLYDGETGEVYAYQRITRDPAGVTVEQWVAV
jgi:hypothetical protein